MRNKVWVYNPKPAKLNDYKKAALKEDVQDFIKKSENFLKQLTRLK